MYNARFNDSHAVWLHLRVSNHNICDGKLAMEAAAKDLSEKQRWSINTKAITIHFWGGGILKYFHIPSMK